MTASHAEPPANRRSGPVSPLRNDGTNLRSAGVQDVAEERWVVRRLNQSPDVKINQK